MRFERQHPRRATWKAVYGWNPTLGWFCTLYQGERIVAAYHARTAPDSRLKGVVGLLVEHGYFEGSGADAVVEAYDLLQVVDDVEDIEDPDIRRAAQVLVNLKKAANKETD